MPPCSFSGCDVRDVRDLVVLPVAQEFYELLLL